MLRYFILGGCVESRVHGAGVEVRGAWIEGTLDLDHQSARRRIALHACHVEEAIHARAARLGALSLDHSRNLALVGDGMRVDGGLSLDAARCAGAVSLPGATINGQFTAEGACFEFDGGTALDAAGARIEGGVFLDDMCCLGAVSLIESRIGGQLVLEGAHLWFTQGTALDTQGAHVTGGIFFDGARCAGAVSLVGSTIGGQLSANDAHFEFSEGTALDLQSAQIDGGVFLRGDVRFASANFDSARTTVLADVLSIWSRAETFNLDGFVYHGFATAQPNVDVRLAWLARGSHVDGAFYPQPYTQFAMVMRNAGHETEARTVLYHRDRLIRRDARSRYRTSLGGSWGDRLYGLWQDALWLGHLAWDHLLRWTVGYGHRPFRSLAVLLALFLAATTLAHLAWEAGHFAPASPVILTSPEWRATNPEIDGAAAWYANPAAAWSEIALAGHDWQSFNRYIWAADVVIPLIPFGQVEAWQPSTARGLWGWWLWALSPILNLLGWVVTALGAAAVTGIVRRD